MGRPTKAFRYQPLEKVLGLPRAHPLKSDVWSLGLVFLELLLGEALFSQSRGPKEHVEVLYSLFGPALGRFEAPLKSAGLWPAPSFTAKHAKSSLQGYLYKRLHKYARLSRLDRVTKEFVVGCLDLDPDNRYSVRQALAHPYFSAHPQACSPAE